jgi:hypothetical protein
MPGTQVDDRCFRGAYCLHHQGDDQLITLMMEAVRATETSVSIYLTTWQYVPKD